MKNAGNALKKIVAKWNSRTTEHPNVPFSNAELREHNEANPGPWKLLNENPNRRARRFKAEDPKVVNCRAQTRGRVNYKVLNNMAYFALRVHGYQAMGIKVAPQPIKNAAPAQAA